VQKETDANSFALEDGSAIGAPRASGDPQCHIARYAKVKRFIYPDGEGFWKEYFWPRYS
jgi:hypothetical protein